MHGKSLRSIVIRAALLTMGAAALAVGLFHPYATAQSNRLPKPEFNASGELERPVGYREWVYVGTPLTPNELNPPEAAFPEFHNVYIHPDDFRYFSESGRFPDGTVIIKELVTVGSKAAVSGNGYFMGEFVGLEATIKDSGRFASEPGNWAYFSFGHSYPLADTAAAFPTAACNSCHEASAATDFVFTQYYPVLSAAQKGQASGRSMNRSSSEYQQMSNAMSAATENIMEPTADTGNVDSVVPTNTEALLAYLRRGDYKQFEARESSMHPGRGPHTKVGLPVRVFLDPKLDASLKAGNTSHPPGAAAVKEMHDESGNLAGWAAMVKTTTDSEGGKGWYWYEVTSTEAGSEPVAAGNGLPMCFGCHAVGNDFVLSGYPLQ